MSFEASRSDVQGWGRTGLIAVVVLVVALVSLLVVRPARAQGDVHVFTSPPGTHKFFDFGRPGLRLGDRLVARGALLDEAQETEVGSFSMDCFVVRAISDEPAGPGGVYRCSYLFQLAEGDLILEGLDPHGPGIHTFAVVGGTEAFASARGDATLIDGATGAEFVISLT